MADLNRFLNEFQNGFQPTSRFLVQFYLPNDLIGSILSLLAGGTVAATTTGTTFTSVTQGTTSPTIDIVQKWLYTGFLCTEARTPDRGFAMVEQSMYGITEYFPYHAEHTPLECRFLNPLTPDEFDNGIPRFFWYWQNVIQNQFAGPDSGLDFGFPSDYYARIWVTQIDRQDDETLTYQFNNAFPQTVGSEPLSWGAENEFTHLPVTFRYSTWQILPQTGAPIGL